MIRMTSFAGLPDSNAKDIDHMTYWLLSRNAVRDSKTLPEMYSTLEKEYDLVKHIDFCRQYDDLVALCWPPSWKTVVRTLMIIYLRRTTDNSSRTICRRFD